MNATQLRRLVTAVSGCDEMRSNLSIEACSKKSEVRSPTGVARAQEYSEGEQLLEHLLACVALGIQCT